MLDFNVDEDKLVLFFDGREGPAPEVTLEQDEDDDTLQHLVLNGARVAAIGNAAGLSLAHVSFVDQSLPAD